MSPIYVVARSDPLGVIPRMRPTNLLAVFVLLFLPFVALGQPATAANTLKVATFNIQNFGPTKANRPAVMAILVKIMRRYDVIAVQEVSDKTGNAPRKLLDAINADGSKYALLLSERGGLQPNDKSSIEAYAFYYNTRRVAARDQGQLYPDGQHDYFQREPFVAGFKFGTQDFVMITVHTAPEQAREEIAALGHVITWARQKYPNEDSFVTVGDYNASCSYVSGSELAALRANDLPYLWVVPDDADTNLAASACAYDRIVVTDGLKPAFKGRWGVDHAFQSKTVSDHWPVWAEFVFP